jgi:ER-bound oxygenase mpaB/B'/Rubber oxygenase, catalytic domain
MSGTATKPPDPPVLTAFPFNLAVKLLAPGDIRPTEQQRTDYQRFTRIGDPLADGVVEMFRGLPTGAGRAMFETALERGIDAVPDAPAELVAFFDHIETLPVWLDHARLDKGARVLGRTGLWTTNLTLTMLGLNGGYVASRADKTLVAAGGLDVMAPRRLTETLTWLVDIIEPGGLDRFGNGFKSTARVRLMHAMVRAGMNRRPDWNYKEWDDPLNQSQIVGTLLLFSVVNLFGLRALGLRFSRKEREAVLHLWRYVGMLMGVDPQMLPADENDSWRLLWLQADYEFRPDDDSRRLSQALVGALPAIYNVTGNDLRSRMLRRAVVGYSIAYSRTVLGKTNSDFLGLPASLPFQVAVLGTAAINAVLEIPRQLTPGATRLSESLGHRAQRAMVGWTVSNLGGDRTYVRHDQLGDQRLAKTADPTTTIRTA